MKTFLRWSLYSRAGLGCLVLAALLEGSVKAQALIHSHNDYLRKKPFYEAVQAKAYSIEADVFVKDTLLCVAHTALEINTSKTLDKLYLEPLYSHYVDVKAGKTGAGRYLPVLVIDIKNDHRKVFALLLPRLVIMQQRLKSRGIDTMPVFVISGNRPPVDSFSVYPSYIRFDGRPSEQYDSTILEKVAFISDQYLKYATWAGKGTLPLTDSATLSRLVRSVHDKGKKLRLWNTPDSSVPWAAFTKLGVDIINTDQPVKCRKFLQGKGL